MHIRAMQAPPGVFAPGGRTALLLIHGLTGTPVEMRYIAKRAAAEGFTVLSLQLPGHCADEATLVATGWQDWARAVEQAVVWLRQHADIVVAGGLSMGAILALHAAARGPGRVDGVALYSTTLFYDGWNLPWTRHLLPAIAFAQPLLRLFPGGARLAFTEQAPYGIKDTRLRQRVAAQMQGGDSEAAGLARTPLASMRQLLRLIRRTKRLLPEVRVPALVVHSSEDDLTSLRNAAYVAERVNGPVQQVILDDCYHMITIDRQRDLVAGATTDFLRRLEQAAGGAVRQTTSRAQVA